MTPIDIRDTRMKVSNNWINEHLASTNGDEL